MKPDNLGRIWLVFLLCSFATMPAKAEKYRIPNLSMLNQEAEALHFYDDLVKGKTVAINFIFTRCEMVCPLAGFRFAQLRTLIEAQTDKDQTEGKQPAARIDSLQLISITTDVPFDTPQRLKDWAAQFGAGKGWTQITGNQQNVTALLKALQAFVVDKEEHSSMVLLYNDPAQRAKWLNGNSDPQTLLSELRDW